MNDCWTINHFKLHKVLLMVQCIYWWWCLLALLLRCNPTINTRRCNLELWTIEVCLFITHYFCSSGRFSYVYGQQENIWVTKYNYKIFNKYFAPPLLFNLQMSIKWLLIRNVLQMSKEENLDFLSWLLQIPNVNYQKYDEIVSIDFIVFEMLQSHEICL